MAEDKKFKMEDVYKTIDDMLEEDNEELDRLADEIYEEAYKRITGKELPPEK